MKREQVLIVEDDEDIREGVRILLESENYDVREAPMSPYFSLPLRRRNQTNFWG